VVEQGLDLGGLVGLSGIGVWAMITPWSCWRAEESSLTCPSPTPQPLAVDRDALGRAVLRPGRLLGCGQGP